MRATYRSLQSQLAALESDVQTGTQQAAEQLQASIQQKLGSIQQLRQGLSIELNQSDAGIDPALQSALQSLQAELSGLEADIQAGVQQAIAQIQSGTQARLGQIQQLRQGAAIELDSTESDAIALPIEALHSEIGGLTSDLQQGVERATGQLRDRLQARIEAIAGIRQQANDEISLPEGDLPASELRAGISSLWAEIESLAIDLQQSTQRATEQLQAKIQERLSGIQQLRQDVPAPTAGQSVDVGTLQELQAELTNLGSDLESGTQQATAPNPGQHPTKVSQHPAATAGHHCRTRASRRRGYHRRSACQPRCTAGRTDRPYCRSRN